MQPVISIEQLSKTYASGHPALKQIDLQIRKGDFLTIVGPSDDYIDIHSMRWESLTAITEIDLTPGTGPNFEGD